MTLLLTLDDHSLQVQVVISMLVTQQLNSFLPLKDQALKETLYRQSQYNYNPLLLEVEIHEVAVMVR